MRDGQASVAEIDDKVAREELILEFLRRLEPRRQGHHGAHVALSRLSPLSRRQSHLRLAGEGLSRLAQSSAGHLFRLANDDLLFIHDVSSETAVKAELSRLRMLFADDPLMQDVEDAATFSRVYDLADEFSAVVQLVRNQRVRRGAATGAGAAGDDGVKERLRLREQQGRPVPANLLPRLDAALASIDLSSFVRRHPVCHLPPDAPPEYVFTDVSLSLTALSEAVVPAFDLTAERSIACYLAEKLDRRILTMLLRQEPQAQRGNLAIPLTLGTLVSEAFRHFDDQISISRRGSIVLKLGVTDIFADPDAARFAVRLARQRGYRTLASGITPFTLPLFAFEGLGIDFVRCDCNPSLLLDAALAEQLSAASRRMAPARLVLAGIQSHEALALGISAGIELFQGRYLERALRDAKWRRRLCMLIGRGEGGGEGVPAV